MHIVFYISSHGHGHAVRESFLINEIPLDIEVTVVSSVEEDFFQDELERPYSYRSLSYDAGIIQEDALVIDIPATIDAIIRQNRYNQEQFRSELCYLKSVGATCIVSDSVPWVALLAQELSIPSILISNFTWVDILEPYVQEFQELQSIVEGFQEALGRYSHVIELTPTMESVRESTGDAVRKENQVLFRKGMNRHEELCEILGIPVETKVGLIYVGVYGVDEADWKRLETVKGWHFIGLYDIPVKLANYTRIDKTLWTLQDFSASVDVMVGKLGYNVVTEALVAGTPLLYIPRLSFSESYALEEYLERHSACFSVSEEEFRSMEWFNKLLTLSSCKDDPLHVKPVKEIATWILSQAEQGLQ